ncbi:MAG: hypothetical protein LBE56_07390 [Tannerella sp.]|jgi:hypothetical protein|nr:hypothetical protein [Tannerella sp.]
MKVSDKYYDEVFEFAGLWDLPSKCGLRIIFRDGKKIVIVTELYQENPGTSVTAAGYALAKQICVSKGILPEELIYIECNPDTNSKLTFYDEEYFEVTFPEIKGLPGRAGYRLLTEEEVKEIFKNWGTGQA